MTFCAAMKVRDGLVALADTRVTTGSERITARKVSIHQHGRHSMFLMTSGLRSARDKALTYFSEVLESRDATFDKLYQAVNAFGQQVRRVASEDKAALEEAKLPFNLHSLVGGQLERDDEHRLYLIYPQGNWVEVSYGTPYYIIGESAYGKPLLDRVLRYESSLSTALKVGYLAFDATRTSATDVDFPLDVVIYPRNTYHALEHRFEKESMLDAGDWWQQRVRSSVDELPSTWVDNLLKGVKPGDKPLFRGYKRRAKKK
ncbi:MAG: peptidase [Phycisphaera sp.]|nr:peptidase [Phycisphaera sp.]